MLIVTRLLVVDLSSSDTEVVRVLVVTRLLVMVPRLSKTHWMLSIVDSSADSSCLLGEDVFLLALTLAWPKPNPTQCASGGGRSAVVLPILKSGRG